jgi:RND family efflux transporter MFP subunit
MCYFALAIRRVQGKSMSPKFVPALVLAGATLLLSACEEEAPPVAERVRAIKTFTVTEAAGGNVRRYSGTILAADRTSLSFAASGSVESVAVNQGDRVQAGQLLAALDPKPFQLDVDAARADVRSAKATLEQEALALDRQRILFKKKIAAKAAYDKAAAAEAAAREEVNVVESKLALAVRNLEKAKLIAPFDGIIATRDVEPFVEVSAGQTLFEINSDGTLELVLSVPDAQIGRLTVGQDLAIDVGTVAECGCAGEIVEIGATSGPANAVDVKAIFFGAPPDLLPGMSGEATITVAGPGTARGYLVPLDAIAPAETETGQGFVFKYSPESETVTKVPVSAGEGRENLLEVVEGVEPGDVIAAAGVSLLRDGQKVTLAPN